MKRRKLLGAMTGVIGALAGCAGGDNEAADTTATRTLMPTTRTTRDRYTSDENGNINVSVDVTTTEDEARTTTPLSGEGNCISTDSEGNNYRHWCHNYDEDADFDSFYVYANATDAKRKYEIDQSWDISPSYQFYWDGHYGPPWWYGVRGTVTNNTDEPIDVEIRAVFHYWDDEYEEYIPFGSATDLLFDLYPRVRYPFDAKDYINFNEYARFELWITEL